MVFLDMASVNENARRGSTGGPRIVGNAVQPPAGADMYTICTFVKRCAMAALTAGFWAGTWLAAGATGLGQAPTAADTVARARAVYADVNQNTHRLSFKRFLARVPGVAYTSEVVAWTEGNQVRKLAVTDPDDSGNVVTNLYFGPEGDLVFALRTTQGHTPRGKLEARNEHRLYFDQDRLVHMLAGLGKSVLAPGDALAQTESATSRAMARALRAAALAPAAPTLTVGTQRKLTQGKVVGVEAGDVACYLELTDTVGRVYREMADFAMCEDPDRLVGHTVSLGYAPARVMAASCQGNTACIRTDSVLLVTRAVVVRPSN